MPLRHSKDDDDDDDQEIRVNRFLNRFVFFLIKKRFIFGRCGISFM